MGQITIELPVRESETEDPVLVMKGSKVFLCSGGQSAEITGAVDIASSMIPYDGQELDLIVEVETAPYRREDPSPPGVSLPPGDILEGGEIEHFMCWVETPEGTVNTTGLLEDFVCTQYEETLETMGALDH